MVLPRITAVALSVIALMPAIADAQTADVTERLSTMREKLDQVASVLDGLPPESQKRLSSGAQNLLKLAHVWDEVEGAFAVKPGPQDAGIDARLRRLPGVADPSVDPAAAFFPISNASNDFLFSLMAGFTQSETSTAW